MESKPEGRGICMLTVTNYYYKPSTKHEKGHVSTSNIELGFKLTKFHRFWWICVSAGVYQEKKARYQGRRDKKHIPLRNQVEKDLEDTRMWPTEEGPTWHRARSTNPTLRRPTCGVPCQPPTSTSVPPLS
jgi:hypothetical protein